MACAGIGLRVADHRRRTGLDEVASTATATAAGVRARLGDIIRPSRPSGVVSELRPDLDVLFQGTPVRTGADGPPPPTWSATG